MLKLQSCKIFLTVGRQKADDYLDLSYWRKDSFTKANPSQKELASSFSFSNKQIVVAANPTPLSTKSRYWQNDLNQPLLVIEREFFSENPREIAVTAFISAQIR